MAAISDLLKSQIRKQMRRRTEEILAGVKAVKESLDKHREVLEKLLEKELTSETRSELRRNTGKLVKSEKKLNDSIHKWIRFMEKVVEELKE